MGKPKKITYKHIKSLYGIENSKTDEDYQQEFSQQFFYANVCQYCTNFEKNVSVQRCKKCDTMSYCSDAHSEAHWNDHKPFCNIVHKLKMATSNKWRLFEDHCFDDLKRKAYFIGAANINGGGWLKPYEEKMFLFPRVCLVCNESNPKELKSCNNCPHANFCSKHLEHESEHSAKCSNWLNIFHLDQHWIVFKDLRLERFVHAVPPNKKNLKLPENMQKFIENYVIPYHKMNFKNKDVKLIVSTVFYRTLTLIYALDKLNLEISSKLEVNIMCKKNQFVEENFVEWEMLLHWFQKLNTLKICFIGCQMPQQEFNVFLCRHCTGKTLNIEISNLVCKEYYGNYKSKSYTPNVIVSYNVDINSHSTWIDASSLLTNKKIPIVLTALDRQYLNEAARNCVTNPENFSRIEENPYMSLKVERSLSEICNPSRFISIYGELAGPKICGVDNPINPCNKCKDCEFRPKSTISDNVTLCEMKEKNEELDKKVLAYEQATEKLEELCDKHGEYIDNAGSDPENIKQYLQNAVSTIIEDLITFKTQLPKVDEDTTT